MRTLTVAEALREALWEEMARDETVFVIGEDVARFGGIFEVTEGLLDEFGAERVINTGVSENAIIGVGVGSALAGLRPVSEIMFCDWMTCAMDQIVNYAAMMTYACGGAVRIPLVIRTTVGAFGGAQHSKSLEAWFTHVPGLKVVMPSTPYDAKGLLKAAIRDDNPVVFFESRSLYDKSGPVPEREYLLPIGEADIKREGTDMTAVATGQMIWEALAAADELAADGISLEVIDPRSLKPLDTDAIVASARKTGRVIVVHEAWRFCGVGAEIAAQIYEQAFRELKQPIRRLGHLDVPHPFSPALQSAVMPGKASIVAAAREMLSDPAG